MTSPRQIHLPALGQLPTNVDPTLLKFLQAVKDILSVGQGINTDHLLEKNVTRRDLEALGFDPSVIDNEDVVYTFGGGTEEASGSPPDAPTNFQVTQRAFSNKLTWTNPSNSDFAAIWVYFGINGVDYDLIAVITAPTSFYIHSLLEAYGDRQYYKITAVNTAQQESAAALADITRTVKDTINELTDLLFGTSDYYTRNYNIIADSFTFSQPSEHVIVWTDKNFLEGDIVTYGSPPGGGGGDPSNAYFALVDITSPAAAPDVNANWQNLTNDEFVGLASTKSVFKIGYVDGQTTLGLRGDMIIDGGVLARSLSATDTYTNHLQSNNWNPGVSGYNLDANTGYITTYDIDIDITDGYIISRDSETTDYVEMTAGELVYYRWTGSDYVESKALKHIEADDSFPSGSLITLPGYWFTVPIIRVFMDRVGIYDYSHPGDQTIECYAGNPTLDPASGVVTFTAITQLVSSSNSVSQYPAASVTSYLGRGNYYYFTWWSLVADCGSSGYLGDNLYTPQAATAFSADRVQVTVQVVTAGVAGNHKIIANPADGLVSSGGWNSSVKLWLDVLVNGSWINSVRSISGVGGSGNYTFDYTNTSGVDRVRVRITPLNTFLGRLTIFCTSIPVTFKISKIVSHVNSATVLAPGVCSYLAIEESA